MPPGVEQWGFVENLAAFLQGQTAMTISWPPYGRWAAGYGTDQEALSWVPKSHDRRQGRLCPAAGRPSAARRRLRAVGRLDQQEQGRRLPVHPVAEQRGHQHAARAAALRPARPVPRLALHQRRNIWRSGRMRRTTWRRCRQGAETGLLDLSLLQTDKYEEVLRQAISKLWAGEDPQGDPRRRRGAVGRDHREDRRRQAEGRLSRLGLQSRAPIRNERSAVTGRRSPPSCRAQGGASDDGDFRRTRHGMSEMQHRR